MAYTLTKTFSTFFDSTYVVGTTIELIHFRNLALDVDERTAIYLEAIYAQVNLKSFGIQKFPDYDGTETEGEKVSEFYATQAASQKIGLKFLGRKLNSGVWTEISEIIITNVGRKQQLDLLPSYLTQNNIRLFEESDALGVQLVNYGNGLLKVTVDTIRLDAGVRIEVSKKNSLELENRIMALESLLGLFSAPTATAVGRNGLVPGAGIGQENRLLRGDGTWQSAIAKIDIGLGNIDNTSDLNKPISTANQTALNLKANINNAILTGVPLTPTAILGTNNTQIANTAFVVNAISTLVASAPGALDTLNELAIALGNDANFSTTVTNALALKAPITNANFIGNVTVSGYLKSAGNIFKGATGVNQSIPNSSVTKVNLEKITDSNNQYNNSLSRLVANTVEVWQITTFITFSLSVNSRILLYVYKNGGEIPGISRIMDSIVNAGFFGITLNIPEFPLIAGDYLEVWVLAISTGTVSVFGDSNLNASYWYGKRLR